MPLPQAANAEQQRKREMAASQAGGPTPETRTRMTGPSQTVPFENHAPEPEPGTQSGDVQTPDGKVSVQPLPADKRAKFEASFGVDLSDVTIHSGPGADALCRQQGATAYATGSSIYMGSGAGAQGSPGYDRVLGHEVTHVVQQRGGNVQGSTGGDLEKEADEAGKLANQGEPAPVSGSAPSGTVQKEEAERGETQRIRIPIGSNRHIAIVPPNRDGDWALGVGDVVEFTEGINEEGEKWWRKSIPTPFYGLCADLGIGVEGKFGLGKVQLKSIMVRYKKATNTYEIEGQVATSMELEVGGFISAGVSADAWIASAGVGLKAKLNLGKTHPLAASFRAGWSPTTNNFYFGGKLSMSALELEAKAAVALYVYYDAWGISTYTKSWTLYERTLGKLAFAGVDLDLAWSRAKGWRQSSITPKPFEMQDVSGNIRNLYPRKS